MVPGSIPGRRIFTTTLQLTLHWRLKIGLFRESNPGPPAPKAGIIPLDQTANEIRSSAWLETHTSCEALLSKDATETIPAGIVALNFRAALA